MKLQEYRSKQLLKSCGIPIPPSLLTNNKSYINLSYHKEKYKEFFFEHREVIIKAQVVGGKRKKEGLITTAHDYVSSLKNIEELYSKKYMGQLITTLLIEKKLPIKEEYFLAIVYDSVSRKPLVLLSKKGGIDVEELSHHAPPAKILISPLEGIHDYQSRKLAKQAGFDVRMIIQISSIIKKAYTCFEQYDCRSLEINPLILTPEGLLYAGDAKITIDDSAIARQDIFHDVTDLEDRSFLNDIEREARRIDLHDHRGVAGKTYVDLQGDIAVLASGGGASLTSMDAIIEAGGKPANYTEYSGNPSADKVRRLTEITLSKPGLNGCLVIGGKANFTDIYETLSGFMEAVIKIRPPYPILIRRAGPKDKEAFAMIKKIAEKEKLDISLYGEETPMSKAAHIMVQKVEAYKHEHHHKKR